MDMRRREFRINHGEYLALSLRKTVLTVTEASLKRKELGRVVEGHDMGGASETFTVLMQVYPWLSKLSCTLSF